MPNVRERTIIACVHDSFQTSLPFIFLNYRANILSTSASLATLFGVEWCHKDDGGTEQSCMQEGKMTWPRACVFRPRLGHLKAALTASSYCYSIHNSDSQNDYRLWFWCLTHLVSWMDAMNFRGLSLLCRRLFHWERCPALVLSYCFKWGM